MCAKIVLPYIVGFCLVSCYNFFGDFMDILVSEMGIRIAKRRKHLGISQNLLAEKVGISNNHMSNIERGREKPSFDVLINLCNELQVTPDYLLMGSMYPQGVPKNIVDSLSLCTKEDIALLGSIVEYMVQRRENDWNNDNFI